MNIQHGINIVQGRICKTLIQKYWAPVFPFLKNLALIVCLRNGESSQGGCQEVSISEIGMSKHKGENVMEALPVCYQSR